MDIIQETKTLLAGRQETIREIAVGAGVNPWWIKAFIQGRIDEPGHNKLNRVYGYLKNKQIAAQ